MRKKNIDRIDVRLVNLLQQNAHVTNRELAEKVGLTPGPCLARVKALITKKAITNFVAKIDQSYFGYDLYYSYVIVIDKTYEKEFEKMIEDSRTVVRCYQVSIKPLPVNSKVIRYVVNVIYRDKKEQELTLQSILSKADYILEITEIESLKTIKDTFLQLDEEDV